MRLKPWLCGGQNYKASLGEKGSTRWGGGRKKTRRGPTAIWEREKWETQSRLCLGKPRGGDKKGKNAHWKIKREKHPAGPRERRRGEGESKKKKGGMK